MFVTTVSSWAQTNLVGRTYHNENILLDQIKKEAPDIDKLPKRDQAIAKAEAKKGRKLTEKEIAELDSALKAAELIKKEMKMTVSVEFKNASTLIFRQKTHISDEVLKLAGVSWLKRKAFKAALAVAPSSTSMPYTVKGNLIICTDEDKEKDTLRLSADGKQLYGKLDEKTHFTLKRIK